MTEESFTTVGDLRRLLADPSIPDDRPVLLSSDAEGNGFHYLAGWSDQMSDGEESIYPLSEDNLPDPVTGERKDDEAPDDAVRVLILWPL